MPPGGRLVRPRPVARHGLPGSELVECILCRPLHLSLAKTSSDSLRSTEIRQSVHRPKTPSLVGDRATGIVRPSALHGHTGVARADLERAAWAAELDL